MYSTECKICGNWLFVIFIEHPSKINYFIIRIKSVLPWPGVGLLMPLIKLLGKCFGILWCGWWGWWCSDELNESRLCGVEFGLRPCSGEIPYPLYDGLNHGFARDKPDVWIRLSEICFSKNEHYLHNTHTGILIKTRVKIVHIWLVILNRRKLIHID